MLDEIKLKCLIEALILAAEKPMTIDGLLALFTEEERPSKETLKSILREIQESCETRGINLVEIASGYQFQAKPEFHPWIGRLWEEKAPRYSRALLETLALIAYRQPITRGDIEDIRGVTLSPSIFKTLLDDRGWIRVVGHREVPGRPALYATTKDFLDYFGLKTLDQLPPLPEVMNLENPFIDEKLVSVATAESSQVKDLEEHALLEARETSLEENLEESIAEESLAEESDEDIDASHAEIIDEYDEREEHDEIDSLSKFENGESDNFANENHDVDVDFDEMQNDDESELELDAKT